MKYKIINIAITLIFFSSLSFAHHGKKYLVTGSYELPNPGSVHALLSSDYSVRFGQQSYSLEPGVLFGILRNVDVDIHTHNDVGEGVLNTEAISIESRIGIMGKFSESLEEEQENSVPFGMTFLMEYEKGLREHHDNFENRMIVGSEFGEFNVDMNLIWQHSFYSFGANEFRYAIGTKKTLFSVIGLGIEFDGDFQKLNSTKMTPGIYFSPNEKFDVRFGTSLNIKSTTENNVLRFALIYNVSE